jgi:hypothetical protein
LEGLEVQTEYIVGVYVRVSVLQDITQDFKYHKGSCDVGRIPTWPVEHMPAWHVLRGISKSVDVRMSDNTPITCVLRMTFRICRIAVRPWSTTCVEYTSWLGDIRIAYFLIFK